MVALDSLGVSSSYAVASEISKRKDKKLDAQKVKKQPFATTLEKAEEQLSIAEGVTLPSEIQGKSFDETLQYLIDSVYSAGDKLKKEPYTDEFKNYRKILSQFMDFVVKNSYEIERREGAKMQNKKQRGFTFVQVVNTKLDELATGILFNQTDQLRILAKIEEINGLLVDFFS